MTILGAKFSDVGVTLVSDGDYYPAVLRMIHRSEYQCLCNIFIVDHDLQNDLRVRVDRVLVELACATWRGVDVRLLVGGSRTNAEIRGAALLAQARARELGIDTRLVSATKRNSSHVKLVVTDDQILTGSHNWSRGMFGQETQDSVLLHSRALAAAMSAHFSEAWKRAAREVYDASV